MGCCATQATVRCLRCAVVDVFSAHGMLCQSHNSGRRWRGEPTKLGRHFGWHSYWGYPILRPFMNHNFHSSLHQDNVCGTTCLLISCLSQIVMLSPSSFCGCMGHQFLWREHPAPWLPPSLSCSLFCNCKPTATGQWGERKSLPLSFGGSLGLHTHCIPWAIIIKSDLAGKAEVRNPGLTLNSHWSKWVVNGTGNIHYLLKTNQRDYHIEISCRTPSLGELEVVDISWMQQH
jgi:hypothetical protein